MEFQKFSRSIAGTPQGSIVGPILANIYLDRLDTFVEMLKAKFDKGDKATINPEYRALSMRKVRSKSLEVREAIHKQMINTPSKLVIDPAFKKMEYVRYADD